MLTVTPCYGKLPPGTLHILDEHTKHKSNMMYELGGVPFFNRICSCALGAATETWPCKAWNCLYTQFISQLSLLCLSWNMRPWCRVSGSYLYPYFCKLVLAACVNSAKINRLHDLLSVYWNQILKKTVLADEWVRKQQDTSQSCTFGF